jgi:phosphatidylglycerol:prolipoprotein diacylglycerol transferase
MTFVIPYPAIDPVLFAFGPVVIRWYSLAYIFGLILGWRYIAALAKRPAPGQAVAAGPADIDDYLVWATLGVVLGGRLGYVLFYKPDFYFANPAAILKVWQGGMSFHGGLLGVIVATLIFVRLRRIPLLPFGDLIACASPIGIFLGRLANFINGELYGRVTDVPWAMVFPRGGPAPRHPSQLYEAALEGLLLFIVLYLAWRSKKIRARPGMLSGLFFLGYGVARTLVEGYRQPDAYLGFLLGGFTMGQWLSAPMLAGGAYLIYRAYSRPGQTDESG